jgi:hypothetical protein
MALITNNELQTILDKLARWATESVGDTEFNDAFTAGMQLANSHVMSGSGSLANYILSTDDEDVIADLLPPARDLDEDNPVPPDGFLITVKSVSAMLTAINAHIKRYNGATSLNAYLTALNAATPTLRAHGHFGKYLKQLSAGNLFIPNDQVIAHFTVTGSATGTYVHNSSISTSAYAGAKFVIKNVGALNSSPVVSVTAKKLDGTSAVLTATVSVHTDAHETDLSDTTKLYVDVTNITIASGGTADDVFEVVAKTDRSIASA